MKSPRTEGTEAAYQAFKALRFSETGRCDDLVLDDETVVREFEHWLIIENRFPYDAMTSVNHMLVPRRAFSDYYKADESEREEYHTIIRELAAEDYYDALVENFPRSRSITRHNHVHLVRWKFTTDNGKNKSTAE
ncbi:MAG: diadenosine tetraphosphate (Ap4A) HIT family hydrolase [Candidatus Azotimanducaceae bacterium]|jgi:diadenosine tetraphosphate (Ap4A) HIT family hydrolase